MAPSNPPPSPEPSIASLLAVRGDAIDRLRALDDRRAVAVAALPPDTDATTPSSRPIVEWRQVRPVLFEAASRIASARSSEHSGAAVALAPHELGAVAEHSLFGGCVRPMSEVRGGGGTDFEGFLAWVESRIDRQLNPQLRSAWRGLSADLRSAVTDGLAASERSAIPVPTEDVESVAASAREFASADPLSLAATHTSARQAWFSERYRDRAELRGVEAALENRVEPLAAWAHHELDRWITRFFVRKGDAAVRPHAEDLAGQTWEQVTKSFRSFVDGGFGSLRAWLREVAFHRLLDFKKRPSFAFSESMASIDAPIDAQEGGRGLDPEDRHASEASDRALSQRRVSDAVKASLALLPSRLRIVLSLRLYGDYTLQQIGAVFHRSIATSKNWLDSAMLAFKRSLFLQAVLALNDPAQRTVMSLRYFGQPAPSPDERWFRERGLKPVLDFPGVAERMHAPIEDVKSACSSALLRIHDRLSEWLPSPPVFAAGDARD